MGTLRTLGRIISDAGLLGIAVRACASLFLGRARRSVFEPQGRIETANGPECEVRIERDRWGIPHVEAETRADGAFAIGFLHGCDRLAQMEMLRRVSSGRASEVVGRAALPLDALVRIIGFPRMAEDYARRIERDTLALLESYSAGVNEAVRARKASGALPPEYRILGFKPEEWRVSDSLCISRIATMDVTLPAKAALSQARASGAASLEELLAPALPGGSNAWAVSGRRTADGRALVCTDPHVGLSAPVIWYAAALRVKRSGEAVAGLTVPGGPFFVLGRNRHVAWGAANMLAEASDLYRERIQGDCYTLDGRLMPLAFRKETVKVRGGRDYVFDVRLTHRGPVITDSELVARMLGLPAGAHLSAAMSAQHAPGDELSAFRRINEAKNLTDFATAIEDYGHCAMNFTAADAEGHVGLFTAGTVPARRSGARPEIHDGTRADSDWDGFLRLQQNGRCIDPEEGFVANANDLAVPCGRVARVGRMTCPPYRGDRIRQLLRERPRLTAGEAAVIQTDVFCEFTVQLVKKLDGLLPRPKGALEERALALLREFDGRMEASSGAAAVCGTLSAIFREALFEQLLGRRAGAAVRSLYLSFPATLRALNSSDSPEALVGREKLRETAARAFSETVRYLRRTQGPDARCWSWGRTVRVLMQTPAGRFPIAGSAYRIGPLAGRGSGNTICQARFHFDARTRRQRPFLGVTARLVMPLGEPWMLACTRTGQSENPYSAHFQDQSALLESGRFARIHLDGLPAGEARSALVLAGKTGSSGRA